MPSEADSQPQTAIAYADLSPPQQQQRLVELARVFLRLGAIAFGGPAAHIAIMDDEIVKQRQWLDRETLLDLIGITNLIPGPNSTELAIHIGYLRGGWRGLLIAGSCFIVPAMLLVWGLAMLYVRYQTLPQLHGLLYGIKPVIIAILVQAIWKLGKQAAKDTPTSLAGLLAMAGYFAKWNEILLLVVLGVAVMLTKTQLRKPPISAAVLLPMAGITAQVSRTIGGITSATAPAFAVSWMQVFWFFLKIGCVLYGSGYVLLAFLQRELVDQQRWLTAQQLLDAVAIGQFTPGPVFTTATFIGYLLAGHGGAIAGTIGIFLPAFVFVWLVNPWVAKLRQSPWASGFLDGVNAASLGLMAAVTYGLGQAALIDGLTVGLALVSAIALMRFQVNSAWLVVIGGAIGLATQLLHLHR